MISNIIKRKAISIQQWPYIYLIFEIYREPVYLHNVSIYILYYVPKHTTLIFDCFFCLHCTDGLARYTVAACLYEHEVTFWPT